MQSLVTLSIHTLQPTAGPAGASPADGPPKQDVRTTAFTSANYRGPGTQGTQIVYTFAYINVVLISVL